MQDRPEAHELLEALAAFLLADLTPRVPSELRFQTLVAANCAAIAAREFKAGDDAVAHEALLLSELTDPGRFDAGRDPKAWEIELLRDRDELHAQRVALASAIRAGEFDDRWGQAVASLRQATAAKLAVAHPGYDEVSDDGRDG
ncbi:MAG TPA: DUF6285 domain-containing protein [Solirubrobacteraceae bacterium]|nr:DUF6285 domain-containing protein [Solirubrobacteraceae bacterium]